MVDKEFKYFDKQHKIKIELFDWIPEFIFDAEGKYIDTMFTFSSDKPYADNEKISIVYSFLNSLGINYKSDSEYQRMITDRFASLILGVGKAVILSQIDAHSDNEDMYQ